MWVPNFYLPRQKLRFLARGSFISGRDARAVSRKTPFYFRLYVILIYEWKAGNIVSCTISDAINALPNKCFCERPIMRCGTEQYNIIQAMIEIENRNAHRHINKQQSRHLKGYFVHLFYFLLQVHLGPAVSLSYSC